jgi:uncharacterized protein (DUF1501 family)
MGFSRREFARITCRSVVTLGAAAAFRRFGFLNALAQSAPDYKALVCVFLFGGNDGNNVVIPYGTTEYQNYLTLRGGSSGVGLPDSLPNPLLPIQPTSTPGVPYAFHPRFTQIQSFFNQKKLAIVANVGPLVAPTTRAQYLAKSVPVPSNLFSHSDQQNQWQTSAPNSSSPTGWAGRVADAIASMNAGAQYPAVVSVAGAPIFCNGASSSPVSIIPGNVSGLTCSEGTSICNARASAAQQLLTFDTGVSLVQAASGITTHANQYTALLTSALTGVPALGTVFPNTNVAQQLKQVAQVIQVRGSLGLKRQIFFVSLGGFDTHGGQIATQDSLLSQLDTALKAFYDATVEMNVSNQVTTFTESDFGRTLQGNTGGGTDHAWGNHQLVLGGAVLGQDMYGRFPTHALAGPDDAGSNGRWIPSTSIEQYGGTLASWFGVSTPNLALVFPNLKNFPVQNLGLV